MYLLWNQIRVNLSKINNFQKVWKCNLKFIWQFETFMYNVKTFIHISLFCYFFQENIDIRYLVKENITSYGEEWIWSGSAENYMDCLGYFICVTFHALGSFTIKWKFQPFDMIFRISLNCFFYNFPCFIQWLRKKPNLIHAHS